MNTSTRSYTPLLVVAAASTATTVLAALYYRLIHQQKTGKIAAPDDTSKKIDDTSPTTVNTTGEAAAFITNSRGLLLSTEDSNSADEKGETAIKEEKNPLAKMWKNFTDKTAVEEEKKEDPGSETVSGTADNDVDTTNAKEKKASFWSTLMEKSDEAANVNESDEKLKRSEEETKAEPSEAPKKIFGFTLGTKKAHVEENVSTGNTPVNDTEENCFEENPVANKKSFFGFGMTKQEPAPAVDGETQVEADKQSELSPEKPESIKKIFGFTMPSKKEEPTDEALDEAVKTQEKKTESPKTLFGFALPSKKDEPVTEKTETAKELVQTSGKTPKEKPEPVKKFFGFALPTKKEVSVAEAETVSLSPSTPKENEGLEKEDSSPAKKTIFGFEFPTKSTSSTEEEKSTEKVGTTKASPTVNQEDGNNSAPQKKKLFGFEFPIELPTAKNVQEEDAEVCKEATAEESTLETNAESSEEAKPALMQRFFGNKKEESNEEVEEVQEVETETEEKSPKKRQSFLGAFLNPPPPSPRKESPSSDDSLTESCVESLPAAAAATAVSLPTQDSLPSGLPLTEVAGPN